MMVEFTILHAWEHAFVLVRVTSVDLDVDVPLGHWVIIYSYDPTSSAIKIYNHSSIHMMRQLIHIRWTS